MRILLCALLWFSTSANAWFFFIPIPTISKPAGLNSLVNALEKSDDTKAIAYASEDKTFGQKMWVWGHHSGRLTQEEANKEAMAKCETALARAKSATAGGQALYDFGAKKCELYEFFNKTVKLPEPPAAQPVVAEPQDSPTARKLRELDTLRKSDLISEQEYTQKRQAILSEL